MKPTSRKSVITYINMRRNQPEPQDVTRAKPAREIVFILSIGRKLHDTIVSGQLLKPLYYSGLSFNFVRQDVISRLWFSVKLKVITLSKLRLMSSCETLVQSRLSESYFILSNVILISGDKTQSFIAFTEGTLKRTPKQSAKPRISLFIAQKKVTDHI